MAGWERSRAQAAELLWRATSPSTNAELLELAPGLPHFAVLATDDQTAGRGRRGRSWEAPPGAALAVSVLLRPTLPSGEPLDPARYGWLGLAAGLAMCDAVAELAPATAPALKWPNDVLVDGLKICGVLAELAPGGAVVVGAGVNTAMTTGQLPVPTATSLAALGVPVTAALSDELLAGYLARLRVLVDDYLAEGGDAVASGLHAAVEAACSTLGLPVRAELPGGEELHGVATGLDGAGRLELRRASDGRVVAVAAGDVVHLRLE